MSGKQYVEEVFELLYHCYLYYVLDTSEITDYEYDMRLRKVVEYEDEHPNNVLPFSPGVNVGFPLYN